jgi:hypothetical protein
VTIRITVAHNSARLAATLAALDGGTSNAQIQFWSGAKPAAVTGTPAGALLASVTLTNPSGSVASNVLTITQDSPGVVLVDGTAAYSRWVDGDGTVVMDTDVSDLAGAAEVKITSLTLTAGSSVSIDSAVLR